MKPRHLFPVLLALSAFVVLARGHDAQAQKDPRGEAKKHYGEGKRLYETGEYDKAIAEFKAADQLAPSGVNDFNIALAYEQLGKPAEAIRYYQSYLTRMPSADNRADVQASIDALEKQQSAEDAARQAEAARLADEEAARKADEARKVIPPDGNGGGTTQPQGSTGDPELDRVAAIDVGSVRQQREASMPPPEGGGGGGVATGGGGGAVPPPAPTGEPKKSKPIYKQWWFWVVAGVSAYVLISILSSSSSSNNQPGALLLPDPPAPEPAVGYGWRF